MRRLGRLKPPTEYRLTASTDGDFKTLVLCTRCSTPTVVIFHYKAHA